ncbi:MAG: signal recognition particle protein [Chloroflexi bacterium]|nr:MAG: signal recognition particle protein [Anaerolineaceae bacterium 4572_32.2]RLC81870.1 MAG: signal recognition particle protein [Chloroflexota bacterium]RLC86483.1 MAG: signal recognition particle protein [Chloroflexota bacterium]HEY73910.1 signal recognition particle protein [Thermoflexia bacterium]
MFENLTDKLQAVFKRLGKRGILRESDVKEVLREIRLALLEADVHYKVVKEFVNRIRERAVGAEITKSLSPAQQVVKIVHEELIETLGQPGRLELNGPAPYVIMLVGLQGSGKTTAAAKLARRLKQGGHLPLMVAGDTYRPAAITQLEVLGRQLELPVHSEGQRVPPPKICANGVREARRRGCDVVILDTAGRIQIDQEMMAELEDVKRATKPVETLLVADAMTGQEAVNVASGFHQRIGLTGLILTKVDGDARGGAAISMRAITDVPIKFLGTGEKTDALEVFHPDRLASRILGMGDMLTLIERAEATFDQEQMERMERKVREASFDLEDFLEQFQQIKQMGPMSQILDMVPGMGQLAADLSPEDADREFKRVEAIIFSMTPEERRKPRIIKGSRKRRIARGSGTTVQEVNALLKQFRQMQKMMKQLSKGQKGMRGLMRMFG